ncbi:hypothetical protein CFP59_09213 [Streptomyces malaysiensis subsp. malaysiensis]|nr:hypothetical protein CFP59_09213 [Streptomyces sp. M56]
MVMVTPRSARRRRGEGSAVPSPSDAPRDHDRVGRFRLRLRRQARRLGETAPQPHHQAGQPPQRRLRLHRAAPPLGRREVASVDDARTPPRKGLRAAHPALRDPGHLGRHHPHDQTPREERSHPQPARATRVGRQLTALLLCRIRHLRPPVLAPLLADPVRAVRFAHATPPQNPLGSPQQYKAQRPHERTRTGPRRNDRTRRRTGPSASTVRPRRRCRPRSDHRDVRQNEPAQRLPLRHPPWHRHSGTSSVGVSVERTGAGCRVRAARACSGGRRRAADGPLSAASLGPVHRRARDAGRPSGRSL